MPENAVLPAALPAYGPSTWTVGLMVFTLVVVPGTGDSVAVTDPLCPVRPESGSGLARVVCPNETLATLLAMTNIAPAAQLLLVNRPHAVELFTSPFLFLAELFSKTPHAQRTQHERNNEEGQEIGPEIHKPAALEHACASDNREVMDGVHDRERL